jgi:hypothetical protein
MRKQKVFIIFTFLFTLYFFLFLPANSYALTYNQFMELTTSGSSKVASAASKLGSGIAMGRSILGLTPVGGLLALGLVLWDPINRYKDLGRVTTSPGFVQNLSSNSSSSTSNQDIIAWGMKSSSAATPYCVQYPATLSNPTDPCSLVIGPATPCSTSQLPANTQVVGGYTTISYTTYSGCPSKPNWKYVNSVSQVVYYVSNPPSSGAFSPQPLGTPIPPAELSNTRVAIEVLTRAIEKLRTSVEAANQEVRQRVSDLPSGSSPDGFSIPDMSIPSPALKDSLDILERGVELQKGTDYIPVEEEKVEPVPEGQGPGESGQPEPEPDPETEKPPPPISDGVCSDCQRTKNFSHVWENISSQSSNVGMITLLNKLVLNPSGGSAPDKINFSVSKFGSVNFDLNTYKYRNIIMAFRFFVLAGAFIAAYYIIYS